MRRCAFLTLADPTGYLIDDDRAVAPLAELGWQVDVLPWCSATADWSAYEVVVIRSTWDYHLRPQAFLVALEGIGRRCGRLENALGLVRWNLDKRYLRDLAARGVAVVPTLWPEALCAAGLRGWGELLGSPELVVKPLISASASDTYRLRADRPLPDPAARRFADQPLMVQPLVEAVLDEGEYSLFYFDGRYSHAVLKTAARGDFRVQEEHGGGVRTVEPDGALRAAAEAALAALPERPLYARVDLVRANGAGGYWLMELELIEPTLYLRAQASAAQHFAEALHRRAAGPMSEA